MSDKVLVSIRFTERVTYAKEIEMSREEFDRLDSELESDNRSSVRYAEESIASHVNRVKDWLDSDDIEIETFEEVAP